MMKNNLHSNLENWEALGASDTVLSWIEHGVKFPLIGDVVLSYLMETFQPNKKLS